MSPRATRSAQEWPGDFAVGHSRHQQNRSRSLRPREPGGHGSRFQAHARRQAFRFHQLPDRGRDRRPSVAHEPGHALRSAAAPGASVMPVGVTTGRSEYLKKGVLEMSFARRGDRSVLAHLYREAPLLAQQALYWDEHLPGLPCVYVITTSGCVLEGDRYDISIDVGAGAMAHVTTQAAMKIHRMESGSAAQLQHVELSENAYLELLPGPVIPHRHSRFVTRTQAVVAESATLLTAELLQPGRKHYGIGELFEYDLYSSAVTVSRPDGTSLFCEKIAVEPWRHPVRQPGVMGRFDVFANVVLVTPLRRAA